MAFSFLFSFKFGRKCLCHSIQGTRCCKWLWILKIPSWNNSNEALVSVSQNNIFNWRRKEHFPFRSLSVACILSCVFPLLMFSEKLFFQTRRMNARGASEKRKLCLGYIRDKGATHERSFWFPPPIDCIRLIFLFWRKKFSMVWTVFSLLKDLNW